MKRCPTCNQTFDDSQSFCANDGTRLTTEQEAAPDFDPMATIMSPPPPRTGDIQSPSSSPGYGDPAPRYSDPTPPPPSSWMDPAPTPPPVAPPPPSWTGSGMAAQQGGMGGYAGAQGQQNTLAIVSLVCGILSLFCFGILSGIPAIIMGYMQLNKIKSDPVSFGGRGMAIGGMATGAVGTLFTILWVLIVLAGAIGGR